MFLTWLWQTTTTFLILLIAGLLGIGLVDSLQSNGSEPSITAPVTMAQRAAQDDEWHPELPVARWASRPAR